MSFTKEQSRAFGETLRAHGWGKIRMGYYTKDTQAVKYDRFGWKHFDFKTEITTWGREPHEFKGFL